jgi:diguanylate cyclase (GGDEF)-like protein
MATVLKGPLRFFQRSLTLKIFAICFICVHIPLIAFIIYLASGFSTETIPLLGLMLGATLAGTGICLATLWWLIRPLRKLARAVKQYHEDGQPFEIRHRGEDEIGTLSTAVEAMVEEMHGAMKRLQHQATTDPLTGLGNRRWLAEQVSEEVSRAIRRRASISVVLCDLDRFKKINDSHGHDVGDRVLIAAGDVIRRHLRHNDLAARIGGEEFCIVLPRTKLKDAEMIAERLRSALAVLDIPPLLRGDITASFGIYQAATGETLEQMLLMSDKALYEAKRAGRNRVVRANEMETLTDRQQPQGH